MEKVLISVIVPIYKVEKYLDRCVNSIVNQTYKDLEIILVDDGSPDNCPEICDEWAQKDNRIKVIHKENGGLSDARNAGLSAATGEYIGFIDSDDWIAPEMYERLLLSIKNDSTDISACAIELVWENNVRENKLLTVQENAVLNQLEAQEALLKETELKHPVVYKLYRKSVIDGVSFRKGKYHEDVFWSFRAIGNANKVSIIDYIGYYYFQRKDSIMGKEYSEDWLDYVDATIERYNYFEKYPELQPQAKISVIQNCIYHTQMSLKNMKEPEQEKMVSYLESVRKRFRFRMKDAKYVRFIDLVLIIMSSVSLKHTCKIKNKLRIGI